MDMLKKGLAVILGLIALAVLAHFVLTPFYPPDSIDVGRVWAILNWFMAFGAIVILVSTFIDKRRIGSGENSTTKEYIAVNAAFYAAALLAIWLFWDWADSLNTSELQDQIHLHFWAYIDPLFIILSGVVGVHLWHDDPTSRE